MRKRFVATMLIVLLLLPLFPLTAYSQSRNLLDINDEQMDIVFIISVSGLVTGTPRLRTAADPPGLAWERYVIPLVRQEGVPSAETLYDAMYNAALALHNSGGASANSVISTFLFADQSGGSWRIAASSLPEQALTLNQFLLGERREDVLERIRSMESQQEHFPERSPQLHEHLSHIAERSDEPGAFFNTSKETHRRHVIAIHPSLSVWDSGLHWRTRSHDDVIPEARLFDGSTQNRMINAANNFLIQSLLELNAQDIGLTIFGLEIFDDFLLSRRNGEMLFNMSIEVRNVIANSAPGINSVIRLDELNLEPADIVVGGEEDPIEVEVGWAQNMLFGSAEVFDRPLATTAMSLNMALGISEENGRNALESLGFSDVISGNLAEQTFAIGHQVTPGGFIVFAITLRGTADILGWVSNFNAFSDPSTGYHVGFYETADLIYGILTEYVWQFTDNPQSAVFLITGFSRGAAVANIIGVRISDRGFSDPVITHVYTFATPNTILRSRAEGANHPNIHNVVNFHDPITYLPHDALDLSTIFLAPLPLLRAMYTDLTWTKHGNIWSYSGACERAITTANDLFAENRDVGWLRQQVFFFHEPEVNLANLMTSDPMIFRRDNPSRRIVSIHCPVNVEVWKDGVLVSRIIEGQVDQSLLDTEVFAITENDSKFFLIPSEGDYEFRITAYDYGTMSIDIEYIGEEIQSEHFSDIELYPQLQFNLQVSESETLLYPDSQLQLYAVHNETLQSPVADSDTSENPNWRIIAIPIVVLLLVVLIATGIIVLKRGSPQKVGTINEKLKLQQQKSEMLLSKHSLEHERWRESVEFFDKIGEKIAQTSQNTTQKARDMAETSKLKGMISNEERNISNVFHDIGKMYYESFGESPDELFVSLIASVNESKSKITTYAEQIKQIKGVMNCPKCGASVQNNATFCGSCGSPMNPQPAAESRNVFCGDCGTPIPPDNSFCNNCGSKVEAPDEVMHEPYNDSDTNTHE